MSRTNSLSQFILPLLSTFFLFPLNGWGQTVEKPKQDTGVYNIVYRYDGTFRKTDLALMSFSSGLLIAAHYSDPTPLTEEEVLLLDPMDVSAFDRKAVYKNNVSAAHISDYFLIGSFVLPVAVSLAVPNNADDRYNALFLSLETILISNSLNVFTKVIASRKRPYTYNPDVPMHIRTGSDALASFYSGHTANVAAMSFLAAKLINDYNPESAFVDYAIWPIASLVPAYVGYLRVEAGKHFPTDVLLGYGIGALVGFAVPWLHHQDRYTDGKFNLSLKPQLNLNGGSGVSLALQF